ncbi:phospholipase A2 family protein [Staphylococcus delphini]|uniref:phospholipase A2 family protein n=1 Tax=Staphylococcus delphini TaxID=53344 RepID=UPI001CCCA334|nr:phospholipase A2 family protein [Staphylococcus delphini]MBZ8174849.1 phospholipase [Staphylococcus delphini]
MKKYLLFILICFCLSGIIFSIHANAHGISKKDNTKNFTTEEKRQLEEDRKEAHFYDSFLNQDSKGNLIVDKIKMNNNNLNRHQKENIIEYAKAKSQLKSGEFSTYRKKKRKMWYGHYCGKGNIGGKPIDALDSACKNHDNCYAKHGWGACYCDAAFIRATNKIIKNKKYSANMRKKAKQARVVFAGAYFVTCAIGSN